MTTTSAPSEISLATGDAADIAAFCRDQGAPGYAELIEGKLPKPIPSVPTNRNAVAFVDDSFWHPNADNCWTATDRDDSHDLDDWASLVALAREKDRRDPVVYIPAADALADTVAAVQRMIGAPRLDTDSRINLKAFGEQMLAETTGAGR